MITTDDVRRAKQNLDMTEGEMFRYSGWELCQLYQKEANK